MKKKIIEYTNNFVTASGKNHGRTFFTQLIKGTNNFVTASEKNLGSTFLHNIKFDQNMTYSSLLKICVYFL